MVSFRKIFLVSIATIGIISGKTILTTKLVNKFKPKQTSRNGEVNC